MNQVFNIICLPLIIGILLFILPQKTGKIKGIISLFTCIIICYLALIINKGKFIFSGEDNSISNSLSLFGFSLNPGFSSYLTFNIDNLGKLIIIFIAIFGLLINLYSLVYINKEKNPGNYYSYYLITLGASFGAVCADNLLFFLFFWGLLGITIYKLIPASDENSANTAKKTLILIGASDSIMILGIAILWKITGTLNISSISLPVNNALVITAFFALLIGSFTKAGAFPFHSWIPDYAESAPATSSALLPASLDKLLGIYFLARITTQLFVLTEFLKFILLSIGVITIIAAVMMALVQHDYKRLLGYHAVSQVGYMVLGFGMGSLIGIAAGLFHMINHALYKSGLLLSAGCVKYRTGKDDISDLGGLSGKMPITFVSALVFALSISGIPPFNGFASKWMIYQGLIELGKGSGIAHQLWILWLGLAVLGSALTLASFIKFIGGIFLGRQKEEFKDIRETSVLMWAPLIILAIICILFGVFATNYVVPKIFMPVSGNFIFAGIWQSSLVTFLILISIILGILIYFVGNIKKFRTSDSFIGGEKFYDKTGFPTTEYYKSFSEFNIISHLFRLAEKKWFDIYDLTKKLILWLSSVLSKAHTGLLQDYAFWIFAGLIIMLLILL